MTGKSVRDEWKMAKAEAAKAFDMSKLAAKQDLGPKLDQYEAAVKAYNQVSKKLATAPDAAKDAAARKKVMEAANAVLDAGRTYLKALELAKAGTTGTTLKAVEKLSGTLARKILEPIRRVTTGQAPIG